METKNTWKTWPWTDALNRSVLIITEMCSAGTTFPLKWRQLWVDRAESNYINKLNTTATNGGSDVGMLLFFNWESTYWTVTNNSECAWMNIKVIVSVGTSVHNAYLNLKPPNLQQPEHWKVKQWGDGNDTAFRQWKENRFFPHWRHLLGDFVFWNKDIKRKEAKWLKNLQVWGLTHEVV